jgi:hypothetical protein
MLRTTVRHYFTVIQCSGSQYVVIALQCNAPDNSTSLFHLNSMLQIIVRNYFTLIQCSGSQYVLIPPHFNILRITVRTYFTLIQYSESQYVIILPLFNAPDHFQKWYDHNEADCNCNILFTKVHILTNWVKH